MTVASDPDLMVLLTLRLKGFVDADVVAYAARLPEVVINRHLEQLRHDGLVTFREGRLRGWSLTPLGRREGERRLAAELDQRGCRTVVQEAYLEFVALNEPLLSACTRWQMHVADGLSLLNEHDDPVYDAAVLGELDEIDAAVQPICFRLAAALGRFSWYNGRFAVARLRVHGAELEWFAAPMIDSYHTVWFELHENLLATLNLERSAESH